MQPLLSIITINYNDASGLEKTMESVIKQTFQDYEYIIIDGASTDSSLEIIQKKIEKIHYWSSEKDSGIFNAMNKGIKIAKGSYLLFLNSGDILNGLDALSDFISNPNFGGDIIYGDYKFLNGEKIYPDYLTPLFFIISSLPHQSTFFKKKVFDTMGFYDENYKISSDKAFYIKCFLSKEFDFKHINYPLTIFDLSGISNNPSYLENQISENEIIFQEYYGLFYEDYKQILNLRRELYVAKGQTIPGILNRITKKIKRVCHFH